MNAFCFSRNGDRTDILYRRGAELGTLITLSDHDLTGYSARLEIRKSYGGQLLYTLSTANGRITLAQNSGNAEIRLISDAEPLELAIPKFTIGVYDLRIYPAGNEQKGPRLLYGDFRSDAESTINAYS